MILLSKSRWTLKALYRVRLIYYSYESSKNSTTKFQSLSHTLEIQRLEKILGFFTHAQVLIVFEKLLEYCRSRQPLNTVSMLSSQYLYKKIKSDLYDRKFNVAIAISLSFSVTSMYCCNAAKLRCPEMN